MASLGENKLTSCSGKCSSCWSSNDGERIRGWRLARRASIAFLLPLGLAILGGAVAKFVPFINEDHSGQWVMALAGLAVGIAVAALVGRHSRRSDKESSWQQ